MKVFKISIMLTVQLLLLLSLFASVCSLPITQPTLVERNQEIGWEAWLLIKEPNDRHRGTEDKQIIRQPKSVFTVDKFPACSEGHKPDSNGQCIKFVKLDEQNQLSFVESKLIEMYGKLDYESPPNESAPTRFELSLNLSDADDYINDTPEEETDMAIIITPVVRDNNEDVRFDNSNVGKRDDNTKEDMYEKELKKLLELATTTKTFDDTTQDIQSDTEASESQTTTTVVAAEERDDESTTNVVESTTDIVETTRLSDFNAQTEVLETTTFTDTSVTTDIPPTTTDDVDEPTTFTKTITTTTTTTPKITTYHPVATTYHPFFDLNRLSNSRTKNLVKFPDEAPTIARSHPDGNYVRFPDVDTKYQQESVVHHTRDVDEQTGNFFNEIVTPQPSQWAHQLVLPPSGFRFNDGKSSEGFYPKFFPSKDDPVAFENSHAPRRYEYQTATTERHQTKKSREKPSARFQFPPKWSSEKHPKPIVLRSVPTDDLAYFFGYKNGHTSHR